MKAIFTLLSLTLLSINSCQISQNNDTYSTYDYDLVNDKHINYEDIFNINMNHYFVYIYSKTCFYCISIKDEIIHIGLNNDDIFFIEYNESIPINEDIDSTIGVSSVDDLFIIGTPTLIEIVGGKVVVNTYSKDLILSLLA